MLVKDSSEILTNITRDRLARGDCYIDHYCHRHSAGGDMFVGQSLLPIVARVNELATIRGTTRVITSMFYSYCNRASVYLKRSRIISVGRSISNAPECHKRFSGGKTELIGSEACYSLNRGAPAPINY